MPRDPAEPGGAQEPQEGDRPGEPDLLRWHVEVLQSEFVEVPLDAEASARPLGAGLPDAARLELHFDGILYRSGAAVGRVQRRGSASIVGWDGPSYLEELTADARAWAAFAGRTDWSALHALHNFLALLAGPAVVARAAPRRGR